MKYEAVLAKVEEILDQFAVTVLERRSMNHQYVIELGHSTGDDIAALIHRMHPALVPWVYGTTLTLVVRYESVRARPASQAMSAQAGEA